MTEAEYSRELKKLATETRALAKKLELTVTAFELHGEDTYRSMHNAAAKRASMDLTRSLARYRRGFRG